MDFNQIYERIKEIDIGAAVSGMREQGHVFTQSETAGLIVTAVIGVLLCLFGLKIVRLWAALLGLAAGFAAGFAAGTAAGLDGTVVLIIGAAAGLILAVLGAVLYRVGVFVTVFLAVSIFGMHMVDPEEWILDIICLVIGLVAAILSVKFLEIITIFATTLLGAVTAGPSIYMLLPETGLGELLSIILCTALGFIGILVQLLFESRKRKRRNLKKAAQIREENSTANEVERARAVMDELDSAEPAEEMKIYTGDAEGTDGFETVSLDDIDDIDEDDIEEEEIQETDDTEEN